MTLEELVPALHDEKVDINDLSFEKALHRDAVIDVLKQRPSLLTKISDKSADFIKLAIESNHEYFIYLKPKQYTNQLAQIFLYNRLADDKEADSENKYTGIEFSVGKSLDSSVVLNCTYATPSGEELFFNDTELKVPIGLKSSFKLSLKLIDAVALIEKMDTHITMLGKKKIEATIEDVVANLYKTHLSEYIKKESKGYYALTTSYTEIEEGFIPKATKALRDYGITVSSFVIKAIAIPKDIQYKIEDQAFEIRRRLADAEADSTLSKKSLEDYEAKLAIQNKYPDAPATLTEYEKDLALRRYMIRTGKNQTEEIDHSIYIKKAEGTVDAEISKKKDIVPEVEPSNFKRKFITWVVICAIFNFIMLIAASVFGLVLTFAFAILFSIIGVSNKDKFNATTIKPESSAESDGDDVAESTEADTE